MRQITERSWQDRQKCAGTRSGLIRSNTCLDPPCLSYFLENKKRLETIEASAVEQKVSSPIPAKFRRGGTDARVSYPSFFHHRFDTRWQSELLVRIIFLASRGSVAAELSCCDCTRCSCRARCRWRIPWSRCSCAVSWRAAPRSPPPPPA